MKNVKITKNYFKLNHYGKTYSYGDTVEVSNELADKLVANGYVKIEKKPTKKSAKEDNE